MFTAAKKTNTLLPAKRQKTLHNTAKRLKSGDREKIEFRRRATRKIEPRIAFRSRRAASVIELEAKDK